MYIWISPQGIICAAGFFHGIIFELREIWDLLTGDISVIEEVLDHFHVS